MKYGNILLFCLAISFGGCVMGKGYIMSGGEAGLYEMKVVYDEDGLDQIVESCNRRIEAIDERIAELEEEIAAQETETRQTKDALNAAVIEWQAAWDEYKDSFGTADDGLIEINQNLPSYQELAEAQADYETAKAKLRNLESALALKQYQRKQQELQIQRIEVVKDRLDADRREVWCADLTEDLSGPVGTIEVNGEPNQIIIYPEGEAGHGGELTPINGQSAAQAGFNWAILPGWQKHEPTYRVGTITAIDYDAHTATVFLDEAASVAQGLDINQAEELESIPVDYMDCDAYAFDVADRVVVAFVDQDWADSKVIGFETNPQPCNWYAGVIGSTDWSAPQIDNPRILAWYPGYPSDDDPGDDYEEQNALQADQTTIAQEIPTVARYNNLYKEGNRVRFGAQWRYPFEDRRDTKQKMMLNVSMKIVDEAGDVLHTIPLQIEYGDEYQAKDKTLACPAGFSDTTFKMITYDYLQFSGSPGPVRTFDNDCTYDSYDPGNLVAYGNIKESRIRAHQLNTVLTYSCDVKEYKRNWVDEDHWEAIGTPPNYYITGGTACKAPTCDNPWAGVGNGFCVTFDQRGWYDYWSLDDVWRFTGGSERDKELFFVDQSWSMSGTIQSDGIHLDDVPAGSTIYAGDVKLPLETYGNSNATAGSAVIGPAPVEGAHHVYFEVESALTYDEYGQPAATAIELWDFERGGPGTGDDHWTNRRIARDSTGYAHFYAVIERPRE